MTTPARCRNGRNERRTAPGPVPLRRDPVIKPRLGPAAAAALAAAVLSGCGGPDPLPPITVPPPPPPPPVDDHGDTQGTATAVGANSSTPGELEFAGDVDFFRLEVPSPGGYLTIRTTGDTDTVGALFRPDGETQRADDSYDRNFGIATPRLPGGTYFIEVGGFCGLDECATGEYVLHVAFATNENDDHGDAQETATPIALDSSTAGVLEIEQDVDFFRLEVPSSDGYLTIRITGSDALAGVLHLRDGSTLYGNYGGADEAFHIVTGLAPSGTYFVEVFQFPAPSPSGAVEAQAYRLEVAFTRLPPDEHGDRHGTATEVGPNSSTPGVLQNSEDRDFFRFEVPSSGGYLTVATTGTTDTVGTLYLRDGTTRSDDDGGEGLNFRIITGLVPGGTYLVEVTGYGIGEYVLHVAVDVVRIGAD